MKRPTPAQRKLMRRLASGEFCLRQAGQYRLYRSGGGCTGLAPEVTVRALCRRGWMFAIGVPGGLPEYIVTDEGRAALDGAD